MSFLNDSWVFSKMGSNRHIRCDYCMDNSSVDLFEVCDCSKFYHQKCFLDFFKDKTKIENFKNYFKITVINFGCKECGKKYQCELISIFCLGEENQIIPESSSIQK